MNIRLLIAAVNGALAVAAGAFGAHALQTRLDAHAMEVFQTAARYHMYHAIAIGFAAMALRGASASAANISAGLFLAGIVLFCGSLYVLSLTGVRALGIVTPFGGLAFIAGWCALAYAATKFTL